MGDMVCDALDFFVDNATDFAEVNDLVQLCIFDGGSLRSSIAVVRDREIEWGYWPNPQGWITLNILIPERVIPQGRY